MNKLLLLTLLFLNGSVFATTVIQDHFIANSPEARLNEAPAETGDVKWRASSNIRLGTADRPGAYVVNTYSFVACVPVPEAGDVITVSAVCNIKPSDPRGWVGIGLGNPDVAQAETQWKTGLFIMMDGAGKYQGFVQFGPEKIYVVSKKLEGFNNANPHTLKLSYDRKAKQLNFWVDDVQVVEQFSLASKGRTPDVSFAGFSGYKPTADSVVVKEFSLSVETGSTAIARSEESRDVSQEEVRVSVSTNQAAAKAGDLVFEERFGQAVSATLKKEWTSEGAGNARGDIDAEGLVFDVQPDTGSDSMKIIRNLPVDSIRGCTVLLSARVRAENVSKKIKPYNGVKIALRIDTPSQSSYPQVRPTPEGTFGWSVLSAAITIPPNTKSAHLILGLENVTGKLWVERVSVKVLESAAPLRVDVPKNVTPFTGHSLPRLRGAMVRTDVTEDDLRVLGQEWNANLIRWQLGELRYKKTGLGTLGIDQILDEEIAKLDHLLPVCRKYGLSVVVDLHSLGMKTFESTANQDKLVEIWKKLAAHYKGNPVIWGYDIVNEPRLDEWKEGALLWNDLAERVCQEIRKIDPTTPIIVEPEKMGLPEGFSTLRPVSVPGVIYSVHMYNPGQFTHNRVYDKNQAVYTYPGEIDGTLWNRDELERNLQPVIEFQKKYGVAIYVGEFSAIRWSPGAAQYFSDLIDIFEENGWDWTYHAFREFQGWSVEHGADIHDTAPSATVTDRGKVVRAWFDKNKKPIWTGADSSSKTGTIQTATYRRILFVGDSITKSAPNVEKLGWAGNWGMAASSESQDYVHLFLARLARSQGGEMPVFLVAGGRGGKIPDKVAVKQQLTDFKADLAIVQMGENDVENVTMEGFQKPYEAIIQAIREGNPQAKIICVGVWSPPKGNPTKDRFIQAACQAYGATFADLSLANANPENQAKVENRFTHKGVNWHPGDRGMEAYSQAIWRALTGEIE